MASETELQASNTNEKFIANMDNHTNNDSNNTNSDYDDEGEWELAGAKSMMKKSSTTNFSQSPKSSNRRRRRLNSSNNNSNRSATKASFSKSKSNHVELSNIVNSNNSAKVSLDKPNDLVAITNDDKVIYRYICFEFMRLFYRKFAIDRPGDTYTITSEPHILEQF